MQNMHIFFDPNVLLLVISPKENNAPVYKDLRIRMLIKALL